MRHSRNRVRIAKTTDTDRQTGSRLTKTHSLSTNHPPPGTNRRAITSFSPPSGRPWSRSIMWASSSSSSVHLDSSDAASLSSPSDSSVASSLSESESSVAYEGTGESWEKSEMRQAVRPFSNWITLKRRDSVYRGGWEAPPRRTCTPFCRWDSWRGCWGAGRWILRLVLRASPTRFSG